MRLYASDSSISRRAKRHAMAHRPFGAIDGIAPRHLQRRPSNSSRVWSLVTSWRSRSAKPTEQARSIKVGNEPAGDAAN